MQCESVSPTLPNLAQLILGSGQRLKRDEVITYSHAVGVHLQNTQRVSKEEEKSHVQLYTLPHTVHHKPLATHTLRNDRDRKQETSSRRWENALRHYQVSSAGQSVLTPQNRTAAASVTALLGHRNIKIKSVWKEGNKHFSCPVRKWLEQTALCSNPS